MADTDLGLDELEAQAEYFKKSWENINSKRREEAAAAAAEEAASAAAEAVEAAEVAAGEAAAAAAAAAEEAASAAAEAVEAAEVAAEAAGEAEEAAAAAAEEADEAAGEAEEVAAAAAEEAAEAAAEAVEAAEVAAEAAGEAEEAAAAAAEEADEAVEAAEEAAAVAAVAAAAAEAAKVPKKEPAEKLISSIGSDHLPVMINSKFNKSNDDFCMATWNVLSVCFTLENMGYWDIKNHRQINWLDPEVVDKKNMKDYIIINHLKKCLLTCNCNKEKDNTFEPNMDTLALQEVDSILLIKLKEYFGDYYEIIDNLNTENDYQTGRYGINNNSWLPDGVVILVNKAKYTLIGGSISYYEEPKEPYFKGVICSFIEKKNHNIITFGSFHLKFNNEQYIDNPGSSFGNIYELLDSQKKIIKKLKPDMPHIGYAIGMDSNQFSRINPTTNQRLNDKIEEYYKIKVYSPNYCTATASSRNQFRPFPIDLIITDTDLLKDVTLDINYSYHDIRARPNKIEFDESDPGFKSSHEVSFEDLNISRIIRERERERIAREQARERERRIARERERIAREQARERERDDASKLFTEKIEMVRNITGISYKEADNFLNFAEGDINTAVELYFSQMTQS